MTFPIHGRWPLAAPLRTPDARRQTQGGLLTTDYRLLTSPLLLSTD